MRRKDREITDFDQIMSIIEKCDVCRLALNDKHYPYIVPMNFGSAIENGQLYLYFHCANAGKKLDLIKANPKATFEMDCEHNILLYEERMSCTMGYASVIGHGEIEFVEDEAKFEALKVLMRHYHNEDFRFNTKIMPATTVFRLKVLDLTGKRRNNIHPEEKTSRHIALE